MKKVLVLSQHGWPPTVNAQIIRLANLVKHLPEYGWEPVVVARAHRKEDKKNIELAKEVDGIKRYFYRGFLPNRSRISEVLNSVFITDIYLIDLIANFKKINKIISVEKPDVIFAETPPSGLITGYLLGKRHGIRTVLGYADPWTLNYYYRHISPLHHSFFSKMEREIFESADEIVGASYMQLDEMKHVFGSKRTVHWIPNGFDDEKEFPKIEKERENEKKVFLYVGGIYRTFSLDFLRLFREIWDEHPELRGKFIVRFIGNIAESKLLEINEIGAGFVDVRGYVPISELVKERACADVNILSLSYGFSQKTFSSRITQYARTGRPTMVFANRDSIAAEVLIRSGLGFVFEQSEIEKAKDFIIRAIEGKIEVHPDMDYIMQFEWGNIAKRLASILEGASNE